ncbi:MAG: DUF4159 domain-containing protein [Pseudomonadota bacterium]
MTIGPFLLLTPLALIGLMALPVIWYILRSTPPAPSEAELPSLRLLEKLVAREETPQRTPWWVLLLRMATAALIALGLALPIFAPESGDDANAALNEPVLVVIDNGWTSAPRWREVQDAAEGALVGLDRDARVHLLLTAPTALSSDPALPLARNEFLSQLRSLRPIAWRPDRDAALERLESSGFQPGRIVWVTDGLDADSATAFAQALHAIAPLSVFAAAPRGPFAITGIGSDATGAQLQVLRTGSNTPGQVFVSALTEDQSALASAEVVFDQDTRAGAANFDLPPAALSRVSSFRITGGTSAGAVWLWDSAERTRQVGLVSSDTTAQPFLSDSHYIRKALLPFASVTESDLSVLLDAGLDAIVLTDIGQIPDELRERVGGWIEDGGVLIRFAGPRLAAQGDELVPTPLRRASRAIGGKLTWEEPQRLGAFPEASPFAGLTPPDNVIVQQQVLASPKPDLAQHIWARLADGSPIVTADRRGAGTLVLFHVTANPDWSTLPYSGVFVEMLRRTISAGKGGSDFDGSGLYTPALMLDGRGQLIPAGPAATPLEATQFSKTAPSEIHPPGLYRGPGGTRALNAAAGLDIKPVQNWPTGISLLSEAEGSRFNLAGIVLAAALGLLLIDAIAALLLSGRLSIPRLGGATAALLIVCGSITIIPIDAHAQSSSNIELSKQADAALKMRLAYVETGDKRADDATRAGLEGLSMMLFRRSSVEPAAPHAVNPETDALDVYPILFLGLSETPQPLSEQAVDRLNAYLRSGGALFVDTRNGSSVGADSDFGVLRSTLDGLDAPQMVRVPDDHVLTRSFYLLDSLPGRYGDRPVWIEATGAGAANERRGDGVSRLFIGDADYLAAWAIDERGRPLFSVDGGDQERELAYRFGINLIIYVLTGNYKEDQVHIPALLERLGDRNTRSFEGEGDVIP